MSQELRGRLLLWISALVDAQSSLELAERLLYTAGADEILATERAQHQHYEAQTGRPYSPLVAYAGDDAVLASFGRVLPLPRECSEAAMHLNKLAAVYFMQLYNSGYADSGQVAGNKSPEIKALREELEAAAFPVREELMRFRSWLAAVEDFRNDAVAHAQGNAFAVQHGAQGVSMTVPVMTPMQCVELSEVIQRLLPEIERKYHLLSPDS